MNTAKSLSGSSAREQALEVLLSREWETACICLQLSRSLGGEAGKKLHRLFEQEQAHCACLKGICTVLTGKKLRTQPIPAASGEPEQLLRECYARQMRNLCAYEQEARESEFSQLFQRLRTQEALHCRMLLEILDQLPRT